MRVREATSLDNSALCDLIATIGISAGSEFALDRNPDFFSLLRRRGESRTFVAHDDTGAAIGLVTALWHDARCEGRPIRIGEIVDLRVAPAARHTRVAFVLLDAACAALRRADTDWLTCLIGDENLAAKTLVQRGGRWPRLQPLTRYASVHYPAWRLHRYPPCVSPLISDHAPLLSTLWAQWSKSVEFAPLERWDWPQPKTHGWYTPHSNTPSALIVSDVQDERRIRVERYDNTTLPLVVGSHLMALFERGVSLPKPPGVLRLWATRWVSAPNLASGLIDRRAVRDLVTAAIHEAEAAGVHALQVNLPADGPVFAALPRFPRSVFFSTLYGLPWKSSSANTWHKRPGATYFADLALI